MRVFLALILSTIVTMLIIVSTNPGNLPVSFLLVIFLLLGCMLVSASYCIAIFLKFSSVRRTATPLIVGVILTVLVILKSIGQLTLKDVIALAGLCLMLSFYARKLPNIFNRQNNLR